ncbi:hypothetical protein [Flavivirga spongiicola]|uniref:Uncharacterized protein n=1 Tax=Flavivirga spongiicola TaxID=421621 RepID=A0ABU7XQS7_9FLAO|nr:hypothetical protein [Flavivirga sp. MEBiC05379]MDO5977793.1 hypothetical protein [Flavivirga sp. MEBiC05379]
MDVLDYQKRHLIEHIPLINHFGRIVSEPTLFIQDLEHLLSGRKLPSAPAPKIIAITIETIIVNNIEINSKVKNLLIMLLGRNVRYENIINLKIE